MNVEVFTHEEFEKQFKRYCKKYHSLIDDYEAFLNSIKENPFQGASLGKGVHKVRMAVSDKGGGKSGGMRVITYSVTKRDDGTINVTLLYIYDKSEMENISDNFIRYLLEN
ncbi:MAG: type II toxin-antitoxin system RelE/ParE family toxin [Bacteroidales bacterium]|jgi:hypothetical protein|nr:type II toxin-antitoxin system RelE/ParE family toxin [Bacteroidales bacterium]